MNLALPNQANVVQLSSERKEILVLKSLCFANAENGHATQILRVCWRFGHTCRRAAGFPIGAVVDVHCSPLGATFPSTTC